MNFPGNKVSVGQGGNSGWFHTSMENQPSPEGIDEKMKKETRRGKERKSEGVRFAAGRLRQF